jgi:hypothetical protein
MAQTANFLACFFFILPKSLSYSANENPTFCAQKCMTFLASRSLHSAMWEPRSLRLAMLLFISNNRIHQSLTGGYRVKRAGLRKFLKIFCCRVDERCAQNSE